jgi:peroxiredoxin family protein
MLKKGEMDKAGFPATYKHMEEQMMTKMKEMNYPTPYEMLKRMKASGKMKLYACTPTMEMFNIYREDLIPEIDTLAGAAISLDVAADADMTRKI